MFLWCFMHSLNTYEMTCWRYLTIEHVAPCPSWSKFIQVHPVQSSQGTSGWVPDRSCEPAERKLHSTWAKSMGQVNALQSFRKTSETKTKVTKEKRSWDCSRRQVKQEQFYNSNILQHFATSHNVILQQSSGNTTNTIGCILTAQILCGEVPDGAGML